MQTVTDEATALTGANFGAFFYNVVERRRRIVHAVHAVGRAARGVLAVSDAAQHGDFRADVRRRRRRADRATSRRIRASATIRRITACRPGICRCAATWRCRCVSRTGKVHGGLFLGHKDVGVFTERHERLAVGVAAWAALAMDNGYLYAEAQRANTAKDQFLATLSHELRTPLNAIVGWLSMLRSPEVMTPAGVPKAWAAIDRNTEALTGLIEDLLDVSRIATGKIRLADADVDLNEVVRDSVRTIEPQFVEKDVRVGPGRRAQTVPAARRCGAAPAGRRQPAVERGEIHRQRRTGRRSRDAATMRRRRWWSSDTGIGIHPDFLPHVFEQFRQGDADSTSGLGLGLAIVKNLVELHGGAVAGGERRHRTRLAVHGHVAASGATVTSRSLIMKR